MVQTQIFTVGHSVRSWTEFVDLLHAHAISLLADVRSFPRSRRHPQFSRTNMKPRLTDENIEYRWFGRALGGFRKAQAGSAHHALGDDGFRGYADHMQEPEFRTAMAELIDSAHNTRVAVMCAEADYTHCHRQFIADFLSARDVSVCHIRSPDSWVPHQLNETARVVGDRLIYDRTSQHTFNFD